MNTLFEDLKQGLNEAIEYEKGIDNCKKTTCSTKSVKKINDKKGIKKNKNKY